MVGVLDVDTKEIKLVPASIIHPKPYLKSFDEATGKSAFGGQKRSFGEKHKDIMLKFGDTKIRRSIAGYVFVILEQKSNQYFWQISCFSPNTNCNSNISNCIRVSSNYSNETFSGKDRIKNMESSTLEEAMSEAVNATQHEHLILDTPKIQHNDILPPINTDATVCGI